MAQKLGELARQNLTVAQPEPRIPSLATSTAAGVTRAAEKVIEDIEHQREQAKRAWMDFDAAATEAQGTIRSRADAIAHSAESFITMLAGNSLTVRKVGNDAATFGAERE